jgi:anti-anti-sigma factor
MPPSEQPTGLTVEAAGDVAVVRFSHRSLLGADLIEALSAEILRTVEEGGHRKLVLNFANVESMTTAMVGKLVLLKQRVEAAGGRMALCGIDPFVLQIFKVLRLTDVFPIHADEQAARASF